MAGSRHTRPLKPETIWLINAYKLRFGDSPPVLFKPEDQIVSEIQEALETGKKIEELVQEGVII
jgi:hypothetical protein